MKNIYGNVDCIVFNELSIVLTNCNVSYKIVIDR